MRKQFIYIVAITGMIGFLMGLFIYDNKKNESKVIADANFSEVTDSCIDELENYEIAKLNLEETNASTTKISPNAIINFKICYQKCNHIIDSKQKISESLVNLTKEELQDKYLDWDIERFTENNIILYKEENRMCDEHYILKQENGCIAIYKLDEKNNESLLETTDIATEYLPEKDLKKIKKGIIVYTKQDLNKLLEDYQ